MSRYIIVPAIKDKDQKNRLSTLIFPNIPITENDVFIQTTAPDRLDKIAYSFYNDVSLWWVIAAANGLGKGSYYVPSNLKLRIPDKNTIQAVLTEINSSR